MNNHQSLKAEIDARDENFTITVNLGKDLLARRHARSQEVREKLIQLGTSRGGLMEQWEERWEYLQLILEVYQFARDATVAESWLMTHEPYLQSKDYGDTLDLVEALLKKHEAFEKSLATQEERFTALERLTTFELRERQKRQEEEYRREHPDEPLPRKKTHAERYIEEFLPPPEPEPEPEPEPAPVRAEPIVERGAGDNEPQKAEELQAAAAAPEVPGASGEAEDHFEGTLTRKHEWESTAKKATTRKWEKLYVVMGNRIMGFYKDQKHAKADPSNYHRHEPPLELEGASATVATDYNKRPHVFRLKLPNGADYLFQAKDNDEMNAWIQKLMQASGLDASSPTRAQTLPAMSSEGRKEESKRRSFFTMGKKK